MPWIFYLPLKWRIRFGICKYIIAVLCWIVSFFTLFIRHKQEKRFINFLYCTWCSDMLKCSVYCIQREVHLADFPVMRLSTLLMWDSSKYFYFAAGCLLKELKPVVGHGAVFFSEGWRKNLCRCDSCQVCIHHFYASTAFIRCFGGPQFELYIRKVHLCFHDILSCAFCMLSLLRLSGWQFSIALKEGAYIFLKAVSRLKILVARWVAWRRFHAEVP
jgi:hypothetical protein